MGLKLLSFAHLGIGAKAPKAKADKEKKKGAQAQAGAAAASEEKDGDGDGDGDGEDEPEEEAEEDPDEESTEADETEEEAEGEEDKEEQAKAARLSERARCAAIFAAPEAAGKVQVAAELAFNTELSAKEAIAVMKAMPAGSNAGRLAKAMESVSNPSLGSDAGPHSSGSTGAGASAEDKVANRILATAKSVRGERKRG